MSYQSIRNKKSFDPDKNGIGGSEPFKLSRSKIENFWRCARCFYMDRRLGVSEPPGFPFNLNKAVDELLKKEFDIHRAKETVHPLVAAYGLEDVVPFQHADMDKWRHTFTGVQHYHEPSNFLVFGAVDDIWVNKDKELIVVDYKATSKNSEVTIDAPWQIAYKRQMEVYQWLLRQNGFTVSDTGYFVYCNGKQDKEAFDGKLEFDVKILPYEGDDSWINETLVQANTCLSGEMPPRNPNCEWCNYRKNAGAVESD